MLDDGYGLCDDSGLRPDQRRDLLKHLSDVVAYSDNNWPLIPNYVEKRHDGETIYTAFVVFLGVL